MIYANRQHAGRELATRLGEYAGSKDAIVLALPRGGIPVAAEIARVLRVPLDVLTVRKLGLPWQPELAAGAIASGGVIVMNPDVYAGSKTLDKVLVPVIKHERAELQRREALYRRNRSPLHVRDRVVILVDDGIATGATMEAAVRALQAMHARTIVIAVPVGPPDTVERLSRLADRIVCLQQPEDFTAVGLWYEAFPQISDAEVITLLPPPAVAHAGSRASND